MAFSLVKHPQWKKIRAALLDPGRRESFAEIAEKFDVRDSSGALAIEALVEYHGTHRQAHPQLVALAKEITQDFLRNKVLGYYENVYRLAEDDHGKAIERTDFDSAHKMLGAMTKVTAKMSQFAAPPAPEVPIQASTNVFLSSPVKTQVIALPKLVPSEPKIEETKPIRLIEAEKSA